MIMFSRSVPGFVGRVARMIARDFVRFMAIPLSILPAFAIVFWGVSFLPVTLLSP